MKQGTITILAGLLALAVSLTPDRSRADDQSQTGASADRATDEQAIAETLGKLVFVPHDSGAPEITDTGGVRGMSAAVKVELLAPKRAALTLSPTPKLYWYVSKPTLHPLRLTLEAEDPARAEPLLLVDVDPIEQEGVYHVDLAEHGVTLAERTLYVWSVEPWPEENADAAAPAILQHLESPALARKLDDTGDGERVISLAGEGYWYDALDILSRRAQGKTAAVWREARSNLLDQAELLQAASFDRRAASQ